MARLIKVDGTEELLADVRLETLQQAVGGWIEHVILADGRDAFCDEEGKLKGLPVNLVATALWADPFDVLCGPVVVCERGEVE